MGSVEEPCCPECGAEASRVFSPVGVAFKGSGFHNTDYRPQPKEDAGSCAVGGSSPACAGCPASTPD
jgi:predicted nucleic acid-binding Zn ribbon protein